MDEKTEEHYRTLVVKEEIQRQTAALIAEKWQQLKFVARTATVLLSFVAAALGISQYVSLRDLRQVAQEAKEKAVAALGQVDTAHRLVEEASKSLSAATVALDKSMDRLAASDNLLIESHRAVADTHKRIAGASEQAFLASVAAGRMNEATKRLKEDMQAQFPNIQGMSKEIVEARDQVKKTADAVAKDYNALINEGGGIRKLTEVDDTLKQVNLELLRVKASETVILRPDQSAELALPDPLDPSSPHRYFLRIEAFDNKKDIDLVFSFRAPGAVAYTKNPQRTARYQRPRDRGEKQVIQICGIPFECVVEYVAQGIFIDDYVVLRIRAGVRAEC